MKNIVLSAPLLAMSGYSVHSRQVAQWLLKLERERTDIQVTFDVVPWGMCPYFVDPDACDGLIGEILQRTQKKELYDISIQLKLPNEMNPFMANYNIGMTAGVETDICNPLWVDALNKMDMVIVPSEFTKKTFETTGTVTTPIHVIPESWLPTASQSVVEGRVNKLATKMKLESDFNFLMVSQFTGNNPDNDRKNIAYTIKWMLEHFGDDPKVGLVIKTNFGRATPLDKRNVLQVVSQIVAECKKGPGPKIHVLHGHMNDEEMLDLYTHPQIKALINLSAGEGFGLPLLEAATCGLPVITTNWSAPLEFLGKGKFIRVDCTLQPIHASRVDNNIFMQNAKWARVHEDDFKRKVKRFRDAPSIPQDWAKDLQQKLLVEYSPESIQNQYSTLLKDVLDKP